MKLLAVADANFPWNCLKMSISNKKEMGTGPSLFPPASLTDIVLCLNFWSNTFLGYIGILNKLRDFLISVFNECELIYQATERRTCFSALCFLDLFLEMFNFNTTDSLLSYNYIVSYWILFAIKKHLKIKFFQMPIKNIIYYE